MHAKDSLFLSIPEAAAALGVSRARIHQLLLNKGYRDHCELVGRRRNGAPASIRIPRDLFASYSPSAMKQAAGRTPKQAK